MNKTNLPHRRSGIEYLDPQQSRFAFLLSSGFGRSARTWKVEYVEYNKDRLSSPADCVLDCPSELFFLGMNILGFSSQAMWARAKAYCRALSCRFLKSGPNHPVA